jgi:hypothetical protein
MQGTVPVALGWAFIVIGIGLSATLVGACLGIPMIVVGIVMLVIGHRKRNEVYMAITEQGAKQSSEAIAASIARELEARRSANPTTVPCPACARAVDVSVAFCPACGTKMP